MVARDGYHTTPTPKTAATPLIADSNAPVSPSMTAGLVLTALPTLKHLGLPSPSVAEVCDRLAVSRSQAYARATEITALLPSLQKPIGRPAAPAPVEANLVSLMRDAIEYLYAHPGSVTRRGGGRLDYSDGYRAFVVETVTRRSDLDRTAIAAGLAIPRATLADWCASAVAEPLASPEPEATGDATPAPNDAIPSSNPSDARIATIVDAWRRWRGGFAAFTDHVQRDLLIPWKRTRIGQVLKAYSDRVPRRRPGRRADEKGLRHSFETFFPGAQWTEDGTPLTIGLDGERFVFNWELVVDTDTSALVGMDIRPVENADAVVSAFEDAVATTGARPIAVGTDNATENDGPGVAEALKDTVHIRATLGRPQNDAHVEGAFGLFQQTAPPLVIAGSTPQERARDILRLLLTVWCRATNHRPMASRGGRSRVEAYRDAAPTPEDIEAAKAAIDEIQRRRDRAEATRRARTHPAAIALLDAFFKRQGWDDPAGHLRDAIAGYPLGAVITAIATWDARAKDERLPGTADARYLLGIARNVSDEREARAFADALWKRRLEAKDAILVDLQRQRDALAGDDTQRLRAAVQRAIDAESAIERAVWRDAAGDLVRSAGPNQRLPLWTTATSLIATAYRIPKRRRSELIADLAEHAIPITAE